MRKCTPPLLLLMIGGCSNFPAAPVESAARSSGGQIVCVNRLTGGLDAGWPDPSSASMQTSWCRDEPETSYEMMRNVSFALPARSQRLGPLQMSWGLADTAVNAEDDEWREEVRAAVCSKPSPNAESTDAAQWEVQKKRPGHASDSHRVEGCPSSDRLFERFMQGANLLNVPRGKLIACVAHAPKSNRAALRACSHSAWHCDRLAKRAGETDGIRREW